VEQLDTAERYANELKLQLEQLRERVALKDGGVTAQLANSSSQTSPRLTTHASVSDTGHHHHHRHHQQQQQH